MKKPPICWIIAGPNGAGKTTWALDNLAGIAGCDRFINADLIAAGLSPLAPERQQLAAGRLLLAAIDSSIDAKVDFAFETTLSGKGWLRLVKRLRAEGWQVQLIYLALPDVSMSHLRVAERVRHGGHNIPSIAIQRRFSRSLFNLLHDYSACATHTVCLMNHQNEPILVFEQDEFKRSIHNTAYYQLLQTEARQ